MTWGKPVKNLPMGRPNRPNSHLKTVGDQQPRAKHRFSMRRDEVIAEIMLLVQRITGYRLVWSING